MLSLVTFSINLYIKYILIYLLLLFLGRSCVILINKLLIKENIITKSILETKSIILYPIIGFIILGNVLIILNYFVGLKHGLVYSTIGLLLIPNLFEMKKVKFKVKEIITLENIFYYFFIPGILLISSSDINFHYDAAYYHLNHQNWLRESNLIIGMVNIFWPFGMSSIYEYISSVFWFKDSLIYLHFISLIFIHFFFSFLYFQLFCSRNKQLKYASLFIIIFSFLDNFGFSGGRNGFIYIQEIGKQDIAVAILFCFASLIIINSILNQDINKLDFTILSLICFFIFQLKVSGVFIFFPYFVLIYFLINVNRYSFKNLIYFQLPTIFFGIIWSLKSFLTTGCLIFPLSSTCVKSLSWYEMGSTKRVEEYTTNTSFAYMEYFIDPTRSFVDWFSDFFNSNNYAVFSNYYRSVYLNFLFSLIAIYIIKKLFFTNKSYEMKFNLLISLYILLSLSYLVFYGPIPRYSIGILCTIIGVLGYFVDAYKVKVPRVLLLGLFLFSLALVPRVNSYLNMFNNKAYTLFDPRIEAQYIEIKSNPNWIQPDNGDRCWINLKCTMEEKNIVLSKENYFKIAYKEEN